MKLIKLSFGALCGLLLLAGSALGLTIESGSISVGELDIAKYMKNLPNSSEAEELAFVQESLGAQYFISSTYDVTSGDWEQVDGYNTYYALELNSPTEYFLLKLGQPQGGQVTIPFSHYIYENKEDLLWAVVDYSIWGTGPGGSINIGRVSHVGEINPIPEPGTMLLLGVGLVGLVGMRRKMLKSKNR